MTVTINGKALSASVARELLDYDPQTGIFTWRPRDKARFSDTGLFAPDQCARDWNKRWAGKEAGCVNRQGAVPYREIRILGRLYTAHRLAWLMSYGEWPEIVDHDDGDGLNNQLSNLNNGSRSDNAKNMRMSSRNTSGVTGVHWYPANGKWHAQICSNRERIHLGYFSQLEDAIKARRAAEIKYGFNTNHGRRAA